MFTTIALTAAVLACKPYTPMSPPIVPLTATCEGADLVRRNHDRLEVSRVVNACTSVRCEGADRVRRATSGWIVSREVNACTVTRCEGWDSVTRGSNGWELRRISGACMPIEPVVVNVPVQQNDSLRFGLSYR